ncbi:MAG: helix-turn-helix domain-containing protein [Bacteroidetes bacterium]|jgi:signal transduction histidine kinase/ligand-binding sensor domain-containing protein/DNA-binding response OmpR family regulator|nr:helix-turn-helix domain-containing protein [Bacteroidota bacterium]
MYKKAISLWFCLCFGFLYSQNNKTQYTFKNLSISDGLSQNSVVDIAQDSIGYMWFATQDGLNRYDGNEFVIYDKQFEDVTRSSFSRLGKIYVDRERHIWIISNSGQLEKYQKNTDSFQSIPFENKVSTVFQDNNLDFYIGTYNAGLFKIDYQSKDTIQVFKPIHKTCTVYDFSKAEASLYVATSKQVFELRDNSYSEISVKQNIDVEFSALAQTKDTKIWAGTFGKGLFYKDNQVFKQFKGYDCYKLPNDLKIQDLLVDSKNNLWVATYGDGLYLINTSEKIIRNLRENKKNPFALHYNDILSIYEDYTGTIWFGTDGAGMSYYDEHLTKFNILTGKQLPSDISVDVIRAIAVSKNNTIWLGTSGKGLTKINFSNNQHQTYTTANSKINSNRVMSLLNDKNDLWIGFQGGGLNMLKANKDLVDFPSLKHHTIWHILKNNNQQFWLCTRDNGLLLFDKEKGIITNYNKDNSALTSNNIRLLTFGQPHQLWVGTNNNGLFSLNIKANTLKKIKGVDDKIKSLYFDEENLWIGTYGNGLKRLNPNSKKVTSFTTKDGLSNNVIYSILPDDNHNLWLSSNRGITKFSYKDNNVSIKNYNKYEELQSLEFNTGAYFKDGKGNLYFGGLEGLNWFKPDKITFNEVIPKTVLSKVEIFNKEIDIKQNAEFAYDKNTITFTFSALHFSLPERNQYKYRLINNDDNWIDAGNSNVAHYTNLPPNTYEFQVISCNYDGFCNETPLSYKFTILDPWYGSNIAYILYVLLFLFLTHSVYRYFNFRWKMKTKLQLEHAETKRLKKLSKFKEKLYANISHEFRTPLTLINGPVEKQLSKPQLSEDLKKDLRMVKDNSKRLLGLVNQMLDLSKLETGHFKLSVKQANLSVLLYQLAEAFKYKAEQKEIQFNFNIQGLKNAWFDSDIIEKIVSNLLSNAVKYTPTKGKICFEAFQQDGLVIMNFKNNGSIISDEQLEKIFERYYQHQINSPGVGIGLSLVKELTLVSHGKVEAHRIGEEEIQFSVNLPIEQSHYKTTEITNENLNSDLASETKEHNRKESPDFSKDKSLPQLLIAEDEKDINHFIASVFEKEFQIKQVFNGVEGIAFAEENIPDIIITDLMMPRKTGIELCNQLKQDSKTSHIPIIMLTAKSGDINEIEGLKTGADAYITKPFNITKLKLVIDKQLELREKLKKRYSESFNISPDLKVNSSEANFLNRLKKILDKNITHQEFNSSQFCEAMQMSRTQLHRKLTANFGVSATEFIRTQRLKLAQELLKKSDDTIAEIAYQVGFNTPSYFNKCFKDTFGITPNEYASKHP